MSTFEEHPDYKLVVNNCSTGVFPIGTDDLEEENIEDTFVDNTDEGNSPTPLPVKDYKALTAPYVERAKIDLKDELLQEQENFNLVRDFIDHQLELKAFSVKNRQIHFDKACYQCEQAFGKLSHEKRKELAVIFGVSHIFISCVNIVILCLV